MKRKSLFALAIALFALSGLPALAQDEAPESKILIRNVRVFDGVKNSLSGTTNVLIEDNTITSISPTAIAGINATVIDGGGRVLAHAAGFGGQAYDDAFFGAEPHEFLEPFDLGVEGRAQLGGGQHQRHDLRRLGQLAASGKLFVVKVAFQQSAVDRLFDAQRRHG